MNLLEKFDRSPSGILNIERSFARKVAIVSSFVMGTFVFSRNCCVLVLVGVDMIAQDSNASYDTNVLSSSSLMLSGFLLGSLNTSRGYTPFFPVTRKVKAPRSTP